MSISIILICGFLLVVVGAVAVAIFVSSNAQNAKNPNSTDNSGSDVVSSGVLFWGSSDTGDDSNDGGDSGGDSGGDGGGGDGGGGE